MTRKKEAKQNRAIKKQRLANIKRTNEKYLHWTCTRCGRLTDIHISQYFFNNPAYAEQYKTKEKIFVCAICK